MKILLKMLMMGMALSGTKISNKLFFNIAEAVVKMQLSVVCLAQSTTVEPLKSRWVYIKKVAPTK